MRFRIIALLAFCAIALAAESPKEWRTLNTGTRASLRGLSVVDARVIWASGTAGTYLRSRDGGATWIAATVPGAEDLDLRGVKAFDANTAVLLSSGPAEQGRARILRTTDAGRSWSVVYTSTTPGVFLDAIAFWDRQHGIVIGDPVGGRFFMILTDDGGKSWKQVPTAALPPALVNEGAFAASNSCLAVQGPSNVWFATGGAKSARVFRSSDRGRTWSVTATPIAAGSASAGAFAIAFQDSRHGVVVGGDYKQPAGSVDTVALTDDGGRTWKLAAVAPDGLYLSAVAYTPDSDGKELIAAGTAGWATSADRGRHWQKHDDPGFNAVAFAPHSRSAWAAGSDGRIAVHRTTR